MDVRVVAAFEVNLPAEESAVTQPKVSVMVMTHNHARYAAQTIESALQQKTTFPFEVVIGEDASTDGTREIVARYQRQAPDIVRPLFREKNFGVTRNTACTFEACKGKYIAMLDGDDFWTDAGKLEIQAALLDAHPETALCGHRAALLLEPEGWTGGVPYHLAKGYYPDLPAGVYGIQDLIHSDFLPTSSVMFRNGLFPRFPEWFFDLLVVQDVPLFLLSARYGNIALLSEIMSTYRLHGKSLFAGRDRDFQLREAARTFETLYANFDEEYRPLIGAKLFEVTYDLSRKLLDKGSIEEGGRYCRRCLSLPPPAARLGRKAIVGMQAYAPWLYRLLIAAKRAAGQVRA